MATIIVHQARIYVAGIFCVESKADSVMGLRILSGYDSYHSRPWRQEASVAQVMLETRCMYKFTTENTRGVLTGHSQGDVTQEQSGL